MYEGNPEEKETGCKRKEAEKSEERFKLKEVGVIEIFRVEKLCIF